MKTKEGDGKKKNRVAILIIGLLSILLILAILAFSMQITNLQHHLTQANLTIAQEHNQILNLTGILNLNESQVIFNKAISIGPSPLVSTCNTYGCYNYTSEANTTLHFTFTHAGYIVINTTSPSYAYLVMEQNYSKTSFGGNSTVVVGNFNYSVRSLTMPVLPGPAGLRLFYYNATVPYEAQLTITYHS